MDTTQILHALATVEGMPVDAIQGARENRATVAPAFVQLVERFVAGDEDDEDAEALFLVFHLLGELREKSAYRPLAALLRLPQDRIDVLGDAIPETSHRVMASVYDGDPDPLCDIIRDPDADDMVRSRMCEALAMLTLRGDVSREQAAAFLRDCFHDLKPQDECFVWDGWQSAVAMLGLVDLVPLVRQVFEREFISPGWLSFEDFEEDLEQAVADGVPSELPPDQEFQLFGDTVEELSNWSFARPKADAKGAYREPIDWSPPAPVVNPYRNVGRNDPCPCGSGKKFKKCCLDKVEAQQREAAAAARLPVATELDDTFPYDDDDLGSPMAAYDPLVAPDPDEWLTLGEDEALRRVEAYHRRAGIDIPGADMHATIHMVVENQIAEGDVLPVRRKLDALVDEGLDRHDAIHAVGSVLVLYLRDIMGDPSAAKAALDTYYAELDKLTAASWRRAFS